MTNFSVPVRQNVGQSASLMQPLALIQLSNLQHSARFESAATTATTSCALCLHRYG